MGGFCRPACKISMHTFYTQPPQDGVAQLDPQDLHHALRVLRLRENEPIYIASEGRHYEALFEPGEVSPRARIIREIQSRESKVRVTLYQGLSKGERMDIVMQKCTELGIARIVPCLFSRSVAKWDGGEKKLARWQRIAREAAVQSGRSLVPQVEDCLSFSQLCQALSGHEQVLIPWEEGGMSIRQAYQGALDVALVVGPEGGITSQEMEALCGQAVTLGPRILRTETAGMAALTMVLTLSGDME